MTRGASPSCGRPASRSRGSSGTPFGPSTTSGSANATSARGPATSWRRSMPSIPSLRGCRVGVPTSVTGGPCVAPSRGASVAATRDPARHSAPGGAPPGEIVRGVLRGGTIRPRMNWLIRLWYWINEQPGTLSALATFAGVIVAWRYVALTRRLWLATKDQEETHALVDLTQKMFEEQHRPWIAINITWGTHVYFELSIQLTNHGVAPAILTDWTVVSTKGGREISGSPTSGSPMTYLFPTRSEYRAAVVFDAEQAKWNRGNDVQVQATVKYQGLRAPRANPTQPPSKSRSVTAVRSGPTESLSSSSQVRRRLCR